METNKHSREDKYIKAKKRVESIKGFYWHFAIYLLVNTFITVTKIVSNIGNGETFGEAFWDLGTFFVWVPWGIGVAAHGLGVFGGPRFLFGKDWEERKIKEFMEKDKNQYKSLK